MVRVKNLLLILVFVCIFLSGCGKNSEADNNKSDDFQKEALILDTKSDAESEIACNQVVSISVVAILKADDNPNDLSSEDSGEIQKIIDEGIWENDATAECINDCLLTVDGDDIYYHSECGTFNDKVNQRNFTLDEKTREEVNGILEKYITLGSVETPM